MTILSLFKEAYSNHSKNVWALAILTLINRMGTMVMPFLSLYLTTELDFSLKEAGFLISAFGFGSLIGAYLGGQFSDKFGANIVIVISLVVSGFLFIALQWATTFYSIFLFIFLTATFGEAYRPAIMVALGYYVPKEEMSRANALIRLAINLGMSAGPVLGGFAVVVFGYNMLFWMDGVTCILAGIYFWLVARNWVKTIQETEKTTTEETPTKVIIPPYQNKAFLLFLLATFLMGFSYMQWFYSVPIFIKSEWGFDERYVGILMTFSSFIIVLIEMPTVHFIEKAKKIRRFILIGLGLLSLSYLPFLLPKALIFCFISIFIWTIGEILFFSFNSAMAFQLSPTNNRGDYMSWYWMMWGVNGIICPMVGLAFVERFGFDAFWILLGGLVALSWLLNYKIVE